MNRSAAHSLPPSIMPGIAWSFFDGEVFADPAEFNERVRERQEDVGAEEPWEPARVVLPAPRVRITYFGVVSPDDDEYTEMSVELASDDRAQFTAGELLFKINNAVAAHLRGVDHCYFEGLTISAPPAGDDPPVYEMHQGS